jgi:NADH dehydrogenase FAD-containing subunit
LLGIDFEKKKIKCVEKSSVYFSDNKDREHFELKYDLLVIGVGAKNNTFNVPGVDKYAFFLKVQWFGSQSCPAMIISMHARN